MNGWTPSIPLKTKIENLMAQVPEEYRTRAAAECVDENPYTFERKLSGYVLCRLWETYEHPVEQAYRLEDCDGEPFDEAGWTRSWLDICNDSRTPAQKDVDEAYKEWRDTYRSLA